MNDKKEFESSLQNVKAQQQQAHALESQIMEETNASKKSKLRRQSEACQLAMMDELVDCIEVLGIQQGLTRG